MSKIVQREAACPLTMSLSILPFLDGIYLFCLLASHCQIIVIFESALHSSASSQVSVRPDCGETTRLTTDDDLPTDPDETQSITSIVVGER